MAQGDANFGRAGFRAIAPDWIGHGFSSKPNRREFAYTPEAFLQALEALTEALGLSRFYLVAQGFLGSVGVQYALRHPEHIERLVVINAPLTAQARLPWKLRQMGLPLLGEMITQDPLLVDRTLEGGGPYQVDDADLDVYRRPFLTSSEAGRALMTMVRRLQLPQVTAEIETGFQHWQVPTLLLWGLEDPWLPVKTAVTVANQLSHGQITKLDQVGHYAQEDWPEKVAAALDTFLRQQVV
ncbi:Hydrolase [Halomicronema hongdechloris C2206]|uniref:Hydrolase n=1 Tax=Halomicronema hongdechloris C2206 TaxID=1641165 RepID=A0A1Z3HMT8_9CYAN|nr:alpha/beta fold hydrolase [Halomicronema hongdechloris]ASC71623.1 Hydrolase [Halomicronema hongdechloris C2206]